MERKERTRPRKEGKGKGLEIIFSMRQHAPAQFNKKPERKQNERKDEKGRELPDAIQIEDKGKDTQVEGRIKKGKKMGEGEGAGMGRGKRNGQKREKERKGGRKKREGEG